MEKVKISPRCGKLDSGPGERAQVFPWELLLPGQEQGRLGRQLRPQGAEGTLPAQGGKPHPAPSCGYQGETIQGKCEFSMQGRAKKSSVS